MGHEKDAGMNLALFLKMKYVPFSAQHLLYLKKNRKGKLHQITLLKEAFSCSVQ